MSTFEKNIANTIAYLEEVRRRGPRSFKAAIFRKAIDNCTARIIRASAGASRIAGDARVDGTKTVSAAASVNISELLKSLESQAEAQSLAKLLDGGMETSAALEFIKSQRIELDLDVNISLADNEE